MIKAFTRFGLLLLLLALPVAASAQPATPQNNPANDALELDLPPTTIVFDLFVADEQRGEVLVTYTNNWARFHDPEGLLELLPEVGNTEAVFDLLNHGKIVGLQRDHQNVGKLVVNPNTFQVFLELDPQVLNAKRVGQIQEDVAPAKRPSLLNTFSVVTTNDLEGEGWDGTFFHRNSLVYGRDRLQWAGDYSDTLGYDISDLLYAHEEDDTIYRAGLNQTRGLQFARGQDILGVSIGSNIDTQFDDLAARGDVVTVFVPSRARIRVFAEGRIIYTDILDFGLQQLDTASFPTGSYDLVVEVREESTGRTTTQSQFFTKTSRLVPFGRPEWLVQLGFARDDLDPNTAEPIWEGLYRERVASNLELGVALLGGKDINILEPQFRTFWRGIEARGNVSLSDEGDVAAFLFGQVLTDNFGTLTAQMRKTLAGHNRTPVARQADIFDPLTGEIEQISAAWVRSFGRLQLTLRGVRSESNAITSESYGATVRYPLISKLEHRLDIQGDYTHNNLIGETYGAFLNYSFTPQNTFWTVSNNSSHQSFDSSKQTSSVTQIEYDTRAGNRSPGLEAVLTNTTTRTDSETFIGNDLRLTHTGQNFETRFTGTHADRGGDTSGSVGLSARTTFAIDGADATLLGGAVSEATVVVDLKGSAKGEMMVIKSGNQILGRGRVGERMSLGVQPFSTYNLTIEPEKADALVSYNNTPQTFKLINGAVKIIEYDVAKIILVFGRLLDGEGKPLAWQRIKGASTSALTDQFGNFQTEIAAHDVMHVDNREIRCTAAVPEVDTQGVFSYVGDILCL